ncbi:MAG TPA: hypothetical protein VLU25_00075 [Acidobacteriota bacterium]|nr:hypothetical protein [Acidobacteriota bacterium]
MTKRWIQRAAFLALLLLVTCLAMIPLAEGTASAVPFCAAVEPGFPCDDLCYCFDPHVGVVPAWCCESTYLICS